MFAGGGIGTTTTDKKKMLRRQLGSGLLIAALAGAVILMNHFFFLQEQGFSKNLTGVLVTRLVGDDPFYLIHFAAGYAFLLQSNYGEALLHFKAALGRQGALPKELADLQLFAAYCHYSLSDSDEASGEYDKAIADYDEVIRLDPKDVFAYIYRGCAYERQGDYDKAIADYDEAIRLDPKGAKAYEIRGAG